MGCPVEPSLEVKLDHFAMGYLAPDELVRIIKTETMKDLEGDQYATAEDVFGVLESANENRRNIHDLTKRTASMSKDAETAKKRADDQLVRIRNLEKKFEYHVDTHFLRINK
jgi:hypothetical protein